MLHVIYHTSSLKLPKLFDSDVILFVTFHGKMHLLWPRIFPFFWSLLSVSPSLIFCLLISVASHYLTRFHPDSHQRFCSCNVQPITLNYLSTQAAAHHGRWAVSVGCVEWDRGACLVCVWTETDGGGGDCVRGSYCRCSRTIQALEN